MITFSKLGRKGNIGNQLFQIASTIGIATANNQDFCFPEWPFGDYFENRLPVFEQLDYLQYSEKQFHFEPIALDDNHYDLEGWLQTEKYFEKEATSFFFKFKPTELEKIRKKHSSLLAKDTIVISIRRGDFVDHPDYFQLPILYYINALVNHFPDWQSYNILLLSDDVDYCRFHFSFLDNVFFAGNVSAIEQLMLASLCKNFIISNSTFSWWCAWFGERNGGKIIRPLYNFTAEKNKVSDDRDFFPERWIRYNHLDKKIDLGQTLFLANNCQSMVEDYLKHYFVFSNDGENLNTIPDIIPQRATTIVMVNDVIVPPFAIYESVFNANKNNKNYHYCLLGDFLNTSVYLDRKLFIRQMDFGIFTKILSKSNQRHSKVQLFSTIWRKPSADTIASVLENATFENKFSFAGKLRTFECRFFMQKGIQRNVRKIKKSVKKILQLIKK